MKQLTEKQLAQLLERLAAGWPDGYWLWVASGTVHLMRKGEDGQREVVLPGGGVNPDFIVETFDNIEADGGDW